MTTDDLYLLVAETRCEHGLLSLDAALRSGDDWTAFLRAPTHPDPFAVRDFPAYQALAPHLPAAWIVPPPRPAPPRPADPPAALTLPDLALILADALAPDPSPWRLSAIRRTRTAPSDEATTYLVDLVDPATAEVRAVPTLAAYHQTRHPDGALTAGASLPAPTR